MCDGQDHGSVVTNGKPQMATQEEVEEELEGESTSSRINE